MKTPTRLEWGGTFTLFGHGGGRGEKLVHDESLGFFRVMDYAFRVVLRNSARIEDRVLSLHGPTSDHYVSEYGKDCLSGIALRQNQWNAPCSKGYVRGETDRTAQEA